MLLPSSSAISSPNSFVPCTTSATVPNGKSQAGIFFNTPIFFCVFVFFEILIDVLLLPMHLNSQPLIVKNESS
jgi:hypothetical protein